MKRDFAFRFLPVKNLNYDLTGRTQTTTHQKVLWLTAELLSWREK